MCDPEKKVERLKKEAREDRNIIGLFFIGSQGKDRSTKYSDYDIKIIVEEGVSSEYKKKYEESSENFNIYVNSLSEFREHAKIGTPEEVYRYSYAHVDAVVDKTGEIQELLDKKSKIPEEEVEKYVSKYLDDYIKYYYKSIKCIRDGNYVGARLEAARSVNYFLKVIFGLDGRPTPYYKHLKWELEENPLESFDMASDKVIDRLLKILRNGSLEAQKELFLKVDEVCRKEGYSEVLDDWRNLPWMKSFEGKDRLKMDDAPIFN